MKVEPVLPRKQRAPSARKGHHDRRSCDRAARSRRGRQARRGRQRCARERRGADGSRARAGAREGRTRGRRRSCAGASGARPRSRSIRARPASQTSYAERPRSARSSRATASRGCRSWRPAGRDRGRDDLHVRAAEHRDGRPVAILRSCRHRCGCVALRSADRIARLASCGVLVAGNVTEEAANATRDHLANAGFSDIALFSGHSACA